LYCYDTGREKERLFSVRYALRPKKEFVSLSGVFCEMAAGAEERTCLKYNTMEDKQMTALQ